MRTEWLSPDLAHAWSQFIGEAGDIFRRSFIKPIVYGIATAVIETPPRCFSSTCAMMDGLQGFFHCLDEGTDFPPCPPGSSGSLEGIVCLDLGAGEGYLGRWLCHLGAEYYAVDASPSLTQFGLEMARARGLTGYRSWCGDLEDFPGLAEAGRIRWEPSEGSRPDLSKVNIIMCHAAIEHITHQERFLSSLSRWSFKKCHRPVFLLTSLTPEFFERVFTSVYDKRTPQAGFRTCLPLGPRGYNVSVNLRRECEMLSLFEHCGWQLLEIARFETARYPLPLQREFALAVGCNEVPEFGPFTSYTAVPIVG
jgi:SAM-dependent methyltransferase